MVRKRVEMSKLERYVRNFLFNARGYLQRTLVLLSNPLRIMKLVFTVHDAKSFKYSVSAVAIFKNEAKYLDEWIRYHSMVGIEHFYLVNNDSTDDFQRVLEPYLSSGLITLLNLPGDKQQIPAYKRVMLEFADETEWLAILDIDEFVVIVDQKSSLREVLASLPGNVAQLLIGWMVFGSSGAIDYSDDLVINRFKLHAMDDFIADYKVIVKPRNYLNMKIPHWVDVYGRTVDENLKTYVRYPKVNTKIAEPASKRKIRINHYYSKSYAEFTSKSQRGFADHKGTNRSLANFKEHDQNRIQDDLLNDYILKLKR